MGKIICGIFVSTLYSHIYACMSKQKTFDDACIKFGNLLVPKTALYIYEIKMNNYIKA